MGEPLILPQDWKNSSYLLQTEIAQILAGSTQQSIATSVVIQK